MSSRLCWVSRARGGGREGRLEVAGGALPRSRSRPAVAAAHPAHPPRRAAARRGRREGCGSAPSPRLRCQARSSSRAARRLIKATIDEPRGTRSRGAEGPRGRGIEGSRDRGAEGPRDGGIEGWMGRGTEESRHRGAEKPRDGGPREEGPRDRGTESRGIEKPRDRGAEKPRDEEPRVQGTRGRGSRGRGTRGRE